MPIVYSIEFFGNTCLVVFTLCSRDYFTCNLQRIFECIVIEIEARFVRRIIYFLLLAYNANLTRVHLEIWLCLSNHKT